VTPIRTFWADPTGRSWRWLRRFTFSDRSDPACVDRYGHSAKVRIEDVDGEVASGDSWPHDDPRWPTSCERCGYVFQRADEWQLFAWHEYAGGGQTFTLAYGEAPVGAMYDAAWLPDNYRGPDGIALAVMCPQKATSKALDWLVDSRASNCTMPDDIVHQCWVRHGDPRTEPVTVDKNGLTCAAGGGSIMIGDWHGFLRDGMLVE